MSTPHLIAGRVASSPDERYQLAEWAIWDELTRSLTEYPRTWSSPEEGAMILAEELDELWDEVRGDRLGLARAEATQVGAMALRLVADLYEPGGDAVQRYRAAAAEAHRLRPLVGPRGRFFSSTHEAFGFLRREYDSLWSAIRFDDPPRSAAARVAAAAARFIAEVHFHPVALAAVTDR